MALTGKRIVVLAEEDFEDSELTEPVKAMKEAGAQVIIVGSGSKRTYRGKRRMARVSVDTTADKVSADDFDAIIIPGGYAPDKMRLHQHMVNLVKRAFAWARLWLPSVTGHSSLSRRIL